MLSIATGYNPKYLTGEVAKGTENYYTREVGRGEPPGVWQGGGTAELGLSGTVDDDDMEALFVHFVDPRDPAFAGTKRDWVRARKLGRPPRTYRTVEEILRAALIREPDAEPERVEALRRSAERSARKPVTFIDLTFGVPKSFSILHAALRAQEVDARTSGDSAGALRWAHQAVLLEHAVWAGNNAALAYLQEHAGYSRAGYHGTRTPTGGTVGRWVDAHGWVIASFLQHTNRNEDMHLHIHNAVLNRVRCADGTWRTLDSRAIHRVRGAAASVGERVMTEHASRALGVHVLWNHEGHGIEIAGISAQARALFSSRRREVSTAVKQMVREFEDANGRAPNALELSRLSAHASKATRGPKRTTKESLQDRYVRFEQQLRTVVHQTLHQIAHTVLGRGPQPVQPVDADQVIAAAISQVQATKSAWTRFDLITALHRQLPAHLGGISEQQLIGMLEDLADRALHPSAGSAAGTSAGVMCLTPPDLVPVPDELRLADGRSVFEAPAETVYATRGHLQAEQRLVAAAGEQALTPGLDPAVVGQAIEELAAAGTELGADQLSAIRGLLTTPHRVGILVGPAGTGKSFVMGTIAQLWHQHGGGKVVGLATAHRAAHVLAEEGFGQVDNIHRWLLRQDRLHAHTPSEPDTAFRLTANDVVVVDEAAMSTTEQLAAVEAHCAKAGARMILAGDERQLASVGAGGVFRLMTQHATAHGGTVHTLAEVRRFEQHWEADASLRLRDGDTDILSVYERYGRIVDGGTPEQTEALAARAWLADTLIGRQSLLVVSTGEQAASLSARMRARLVDFAAVQADGVALHHKDAHGTLAGVGDVVQTRRNDWTLRDAHGRGVVNRDLWHVAGLTGDGGLQVRRITGHRDGTRQYGPTITLPADYVAQYVTLGYAVTVHSAQGSTVDTCYPIITEHMSPNALYVAMTRGRHHSIAHIVTTPTPDPGVVEPGKPEGSQVKPTATDRRTPGQILMGIMGRSSADLSATELQRELLDASVSMPVLGSRWAEATTIASQIRFHTILDELVAAKRLHPRLRDRIQDDEAAGALQRLLRGCELAGHDPQQVLAAAIAERELGTAISPAEVLHWRITNRITDQMAPQGGAWAARTPHGSDPVSQYATALAQAMDHRSLELGRQLASHPPQWILRRLGRPPHDLARHTEWIRRAGIVAGYREQYEKGDDHHPLGPCPPPALPDARAAWFAAWRALGRPTDLTAETTMPTTELVAAVAAYDRARQWAPDWVAEPLRHHTETGRHNTQEAQLLAAQAHVEPDPQHQTQQHNAALQLSAQGLEHQKIAKDLAAIDQARTAWHTHTDPLRQAATRAAAELHRRQLDPYGNPRNPTTPAAANTRGDGAPEPSAANVVAIAFPPTILRKSPVQRKAGHEDQEAISRRLRDRQRQKAADERGYSR